MATWAAMPRPSRSTNARSPSWRRPPASNSADMAPELNNLAALYQRQFRYAEAEPLFRARAGAARKGAAAGPSRCRAVPEQPRHALRAAGSPRRLRAACSSARSRSTRRLPGAGSRGRDAAQQSRPGLEGRRPLRRRRACDQAVAGDPREGAGARSSRCRALAQQPRRPLSSARTALPRPSRSISARSPSASARSAPTILTPWRA